MDEITHVVNSYYAVIGQKDNDIFELYHDNKRLRMEVEDARGGAEDREAELGTLRLLVAAQQAELREKECLIAAHEDEGEALRMAMQSIRVALHMPSELSHPAAAVAAACVRLCEESHDMCTRLAKAAAERSVSHFVDAEAVARAAHREARDEALGALARSERSARLVLAERLQWRDAAGEFIAQSKQREDEWIAYSKQREDEWIARSELREAEWIARNELREAEWIARNKLRETEWIARNKLRETEWIARNKLREAELTALADQCGANRGACAELFVAEARGRADVISAQCADSRRLMFNLLRSAAAATLTGLRAATARANEAERRAAAERNQSRCERRAAARREAAGREMIAALRAQCDAVRQRAAKRTAMTQQRAAAEGQRRRAEIADAQRCAEEANEEVRRVVEERRQDARLMAEEWARAEQCVKEEKAKAEQRINEEKARAEQCVKEEKAKAEQCINEEKARAEQCINEEKARAEQCINEEKARAEQCINEEKARAEQCINEEKARAEQCISEERAKAEELCTRSKASARDAAERLAAEKNAFISELREWSAVLDDARRKVSAAEAERDREREMRGVLVEQHRDEQSVLRRLAEERAAEHKREAEALRENITALEATCRRAAEVIAALREVVHRKDLGMTHPE